jgi:hypothetical protein
MKFKYKIRKYRSIKTVCKILHYWESGGKRTIDGVVGDGGISSVVELLVLEEFKAIIICLFSGETNPSK